MDCRIVLSRNFQENNVPALDTPVHTNLNYFTGRGSQKLYSLSFRRYYLWWLDKFEFYAVLQCLPYLF